MIRKMRPLTPAQIDALRSVIAEHALLDDRAANTLHRRGLVYVVSQCRSGCCRTYRATPAGVAMSLELDGRDDRAVS